MQNKIAIFVEGAGRTTFCTLRNILFYLYDNSLLSFKCVKLHAGISDDAPFSFGNQKDSKIHFLILNVGNDEKVLNEIQSQEENIIKNTFSIHPNN